MFKHRSDNPHVGHERALQLEDAPKPRKKPKAQRAAAQQAEHDLLCQSEIACDLADAYVELEKTGSLRAKLALGVNLQRLERATRASKLRKTAQ